MLDSIIESSCMVYIEINQPGRFIFTNELI